MSAAATAAQGGTPDAGLPHNCNYNHDDTDRRGGHCDRRKHRRTCNHNCNNNNAGHCTRPRTPHELYAPHTAAATTTAADNPATAPMVSALGTAGTVGAAAATATSPCDSHQHDNNRRARAHTR